MVDSSIAKPVFEYTGGSNTNENQTEKSTVIFKKITIPKLLISLLSL